MILDLYKVHFKDVNIKTKVYNYYVDYLTNAKKLETKKILVNEKL